MQVTNPGFAPRNEPHSHPILVLETPLYGDVTNASTMTSSSDPLDSGILFLLPVFATQPRGLVTSDMKAPG